jgi:hypothetical protein
MVGELVLVAGLPGSGKTTLLSQMEREGWLVFDDFKALAFEDCSQFRSSRKLRALLAALHDGLKCIMADIDFCEESSRRDAEAVLRIEIPNLKLRWEFFANDRVVCEANVRRRNSAGLQHDLCCLAKYSPAYDIPDGAVVHPVWREQENWQLATGNCS